MQAVIDDGVKPLLALALSDGEAITVTVDHPFYVDSGLFLRGSGWLQGGNCSRATAYARRTSAARSSSGYGATWGGRRSTRSPSRMTTAY